MADALEFLHVDLFQAPESLFRDGDGLARSVALLAELGHPQDEVPTVHVAGTAGKGTVASGIAAVMTDSGRRVGLHVSPHVYDLRERFSVDGAWCSPDHVAALLSAVLPASARLAAGPHGAPTFYEVTLAMALVHFVDQGCDLAVVETGLGGRFDATNAVTRADKLAVITRIDLDHEAVLGPHLADIAAQKAGILPAGGEAVVLHHGVPAVDDTLVAAAAAVRCRLHVVHPPDPVPGQVAHLVEDRALATAAVDVLEARAGRRPDPAAVTRVLDGLRLPGRFEEVRSRCGTRVVLDGAHNPVKLAALIDRLGVDGPPSPGGTWRWVFGCRRDKKSPAMLAQLAETVERVEDVEIGRPQVALVQFAIDSGDVPADRSSDPRQLAAQAGAVGIGGAFAASLAEAVAFVDAEPARPVVVAGSFHLLAALRPELGVAPWSPTGPARPPTGGPAPAGGTGSSRSPATDPGGA